MPARETSGRIQSRSRWLLYALPAMILVIFLALLLAKDAPIRPMRIVVLSTSSTNGEQVVTFRLDPPKSEVAWAQLVSVTDDGSKPPKTVRISGGDLVPVSMVNSIRYDALPAPGASIQGRPLACTPGSYTVAYTSTASANRLGVGLALEQSGLSDWIRRVRKSWEQKSLHLLTRKTHRDPVYITSEPITNGPPADL